MSEKRSADAKPEVAVKKAKLTEEDKLAEEEEDIEEEEEDAGESDEEVCWL